VRRDWDGRRWAYRRFGNGAPEDQPIGGRSWLQRCPWRLDPLAGRCPRGLWREPRGGRLRHDRLAGGGSAGSFRPPRRDHAAAQWCPTRLCVRWLCL